MEISTQYNAAYAINSFSEEQAAPKRVADNNAIKVKDAKAGGDKTEEKKTSQAKDTGRNEYKKNEVKDSETPVRTEEEKPSVDGKRVSIFA